MLQLLGENKKYLLRFGSRATQEKLDPVLDKMEEEFKWLRDPKIATRSWLFHTYSGWVYNKMRHLEENPALVKPSRCR